jgi:hypothetical protein
MAPLPAHLPVTAGDTLHTTQCATLALAEIDISTTELTPLCTCMLLSCLRKP